MKKLMKSLAFVAVAAMSLTACQNDIDEQVNTNNEGVTLEVIADMGTRSVFGDRNEDKTYPSTWSGDEQVIFIANDKNGEAVTTPDNAGASTRFEPTFTASTDVENGTIYAMSPKGDYKNNVGGWGSFGSTYIYLTVPATQTPLTNSVDEAAHILYAQQSYEGAFPTSISMSFKHAIAYGRMTLKLPAGVEAETVELTFPVNVAGNSVKYYYNETEYANLYQNADLATITLNPTNVVDGVYWFGIVPTGTLEGDTEITVTATDDKVYTKTLATADEVTFNKATVTSFTVNMTEVKPDAPAIYTKVTNIATLSAGDEIVITTLNGSNQVALTPNGASKAPSAPTVTVKDNTLEGVTDAMVFTLGGSASGYTFEQNGSYLYATNSNNGLRLGDGDANAWTITDQADGTVYIMNTSLNRYISLYATNPDWRVYKENNGVISGIPNITLYRKFVDNGKTAQTLSFPESQYTVTVDQEFTAPELSGAYSTVTYSSSDTGVAQVDSATGKVTIVGVGDTIITAYAAENDQYNEASASYTLIVEQASIDKLTVAEFLEKEENADVYYELTGVISNITNTTYGNFTLTDGTGSVVVYGLTKTKVENNDNDKSFATIGLVDGDTVTLIGTRSSFNSTVQVGGPAYYVSHVVNTTPRIISLSNSSISVTSAKTTSTITVNVAGEGGTLAASDNVDWVTTNISDTTVTVNIEENTIEEPRNATVTITYGESTETVSVLQAAKPTADATTVSDILTWDKFISNSSNANYTSFSGKTVTSSAVYQGKISSGSGKYIQLRSNKSEDGIVTTTSGGKVKKVIVTWDSSTSNGRTLDIYGKNTAYTGSDASDLYNTSNQGTKLGSIVKGTSTELVITGDYEFVGFRSNYGAMYITKIEVVWE